MRGHEITSTSSSRMFLSPSSLTLLPVETGIVFRSFGGVDRVEGLRRAAACAAFRSTAAPASVAMRFLFGRPFGASSCTRRVSGSSRLKPWPRLLTSPTCHFGGRAFCASTRNKNRISAPERGTQPSCGNLGDAWAAVPASSLRRAPQNRAQTTLHVSMQQRGFRLTIGTVISLSAAIPSCDAREAVSPVL